MNKLKRGAKDQKSWACSSQGWSVPCLALLSSPEVLFSVHGKEMPTDLLPEESSTCGFYQSRQSESSHSHSHHDKISCHTPSPLPTSRGEGSFLKCGKHTLALNAQSRGDKDKGSSKN